MLQYLINTTAIWLISLILFDVFLRRESFHSYNRFYLVFTLLLGIFIPLWQWQEDSPLYTSTFEKPMEQVMSLKQTIVTAAGPSTAKINWELYLGYAYLLGVAVSFVLLIAEVIKIVRLYQSGKRSRAGSCIIIETGKNYSPFSLFNLVFVNTRQQYSPEEWDMLIAHEQMHGLLLHFIDVLLIQVMRIVFWFHPLVYVYQKKLMMLHEYQADKVSNREPKFYGRFLVEQALLQIAPSITHSFNRSPIKNRIVMLTRTSTTASRGKMFLFIPLALICLLCFSRNSFSQKFERNGNKVTYRGNTFEYAPAGKIDTVILIDPVTGKEIIKTTTIDPMPIKMNGIKIYNTDEVTERPATLAANGSFEDYMFKNLSAEFNKLPDGAYSFYINNIVVDKKGKTIYYEYGGIKAEDRKTQIPPAVKTAIDKKVDPLINKAPALTPGKVNKEPVLVRTDILLDLYKIEVRDHKTTVTKRF